MWKFLNILHYSSAFIIISFNFNYHCKYYSEMFDQLYRYPSLNKKMYVRLDMHLLLEILERRNTMNKCLTKFIVTDFSPKSLFD